MSELTLDDYSNDLQMNLSRVSNIVDEVRHHIMDGKLDAAAMVLGSQTGKVAAFGESYRALQTRLEQEGADPQRALDG